MAMTPTTATKVRFIPDSSTCCTFSDRGFSDRGFSDRGFIDRAGTTDIHCPLKTYGGLTTFGARQGVSLARQTDIHVQPRRVRSTIRPSQTEFDLVGRHVLA